MWRTSLKPNPSHDSIEHSTEAVHESCCKLCCNPNNELTAPSDPVLQHLCVSVGQFLGENLGRTQEHRLYGGTFQ